MPAYDANFCDTLFDPSHFTFDVDRIFEEHYKGKAVRWTGILRSLNAISYDFVFGDAPGLGATIRIHELSESGPGEREVLAYVRFPDEAMDALNDKKGKEIAFEGTLLKADGLMKNLYLKDGKLPG